MPYSFTQIEQEKSQVILGVFVVLTALFFATLWAAYVLIINCQNYYLLATEPGPFYLVFPAAGANFCILGIGALLTAGMFGLSGSGIVPRILSAMGARDLDENDPRQKMALNIIDEVSVATGGMKMRGVLLPGLALNAFAVSDPSNTPVIGVTEGLLYKFNRAQLEAVIGHEAGHIVSRDSQSASFVSSVTETYGAIFLGLKTVLNGVSYGSRSDRRSSAGSVFIVFILLLMALIAFANFVSLILRMFISRQREYRADAIAARLTRDPLSLAEALYLIKNHRRNLFNAADAFENLFIVNPRMSSLDRKEDLFADLFSTHPPIDQRIKILLDMAHAGPDALAARTQTQLADMEKPPEAAPLPENPLPLNNVPGLVKIMNPSPTPLASDPQDIFCPACVIKMRTEFYEGFPVQVCGQCAGILADENAVSGIIAKREMPFNDRVRQMAKILKQEKTGLQYKDLLILPPSQNERAHVCADRSKKQFTRRLFNAYYPVEVDKCGFCGQTFFDKDELEVLQCMAQEAG
ncbi:MAG: M48 family metalloprotease [Candidatus Omnitrophica bacterium]|nr:M48 family metalloprotease [Candidatus Omnitrophota bacterium]